MFLIIILSEYLIWYKFIEPNETKDYDLVKARALVDKFYSDNYIINDNVFKSGMTERYKISMAFNESKKSKEYNCDEIYKDNEKDSDGIIVGDGTYCDGTVNGILYADLEKSYKNLFGNSSKLMQKSIGVFDYIKDENLFTYLSCRCGGVDLTNYIYEVKDATIKGKNLTINVYYYESEEEIDKDKFISENKELMSIYEMNFIKENKTFKLLDVKEVS